MPFKNTDEKYGLIAVTFHWLIAILVIGMLTLGLYMVDLPTSLQKLKLFGWHKQTGVLILGLTTLRILWRSLNISPTLPLYVRTWQRFSALAVHYAFYFFLIAMPLTGWIISSAAGLSVSFFGLFLLPDIIGPNDATRHLFGEIHEWLAYGLIATITLHVLAVFEHIILHKNNILRRMWF